MDDYFRKEFLANLLCLPKNSPFNSHLKTPNTFSHFFLKKKLQMMIPFLKRSRFAAPLFSTINSCRFYSQSPTKTAVLSFGDGSNSALGLPLSFGGDAYEPTRISGLPPYISSISAGHYHSLAVTVDGEVWAWGRNEEGQLGREFAAPRDSWSQPKKVKGLDGMRFRAAFASGVTSMAISDDGSLWAWGKSKRGQLGLGKGIIESMAPRRVEALVEEEIVKVSLGWGHALAQSRDGKVYAWGYAAEGRLGQVGEALEASNPPNTSAGISSVASNSALEVAEQLVSQQIEREKNMPIMWNPCLVQELIDHDVLDVTCGLDHSLVLCRDGTLLSGGNNTYGQLGRITDGLKFLSVHMGLQAISLSSGLGHCLAVCQTSEEATGVISWGWNCSSQLGRQGPEHLPDSVEGLEGENPISVSCGRVHSMALTSKREVWAWGSGKNGRLGLGSPADEAEPTLLDSLEGCEVLQIVSGFDHNLVLVAD